MDPVTHVHNKRYKKGDIIGVLMVSQGNNNKPKLVINYWLCYNKTRLQTYYIQELFKWIGHSYTEFNPLPWLLPSGGESGDGGQAGSWERPEQEPETCS